MRPVSVAEGAVGLVIVDPVVGFTRRGLLSDPVRMAPMVEAIDREYKALRDALGARLHTLVFRDAHAPDIPEPPYPPHCIVGTGEELVDPALEWILAEPRVIGIAKDCINGFVGAIDRRSHRNAFAEWVVANEIRTILVVGDCTDICVSDLVVTTLSARNHGLLTSEDPDRDRAAYVRAVTGLEIAVLPGACATFDAPGHDHATAHHVGLWLMASRGATIASEWTA
jgi:nicotinamidase-related amidase